MGFLNRLYERQRQRAFRRFITKCGCTVEQAELATMALHPLGDWPPADKALERYLRRRSREFARFVRTTRDASVLESAARKTVEEYRDAFEHPADRWAWVDFSYVERFAAALGEPLQEP